MDASNIVTVLSPSDPALITFAACAGWPIATVPLGRWEKNGQPYGFFAVAKNKRKNLLFDFMVRFCSSFPPLARPSSPFDGEIESWPDTKG
jgi:amidase